MEKLTVYYNSACPVCKAGIESQQCRMNGDDSGDVEWIDIHLQPELAPDVGADLETIRERLHVRDGNGEVLVGTDAFAALFRRTAERKWMGKLLVFPGIRWLNQIVYNGFARGLYLWNRAKKRW